MVRTILAVSVVALLTVACSSQSTPSEKKAQSLVNSFQYTKDKYGICYAIVQNISISSAVAYTAFTTVPCEKVGL